MILVVVSTTTLQEVTVNVEANWLKGVWDLSVLFITTTCESIVISKLEVSLKKNKEVNHFWFDS